MLRYKQFNKFLRKIDTFIKNQSATIIISPCITSDALLSVSRALCTRFSSNSECSLSWRHVYHPPMATESQTLRELIAIVVWLLPIMKAIDLPIYSYVIICPLVRHMFIFSLLNFQVVFPLFNDLQRDITKNCQDSPFWFLVMPWSRHIAGESCLCDLCCLDGLISYVKASLSGESGHFSLSQFSPFQCLHSVPHPFLLIMFRPQLLRCEMKSMAIYYGLWKTLRHGWADLPSILCEIWKDRQTD